MFIPSFCAVFSSRHVLYNLVRNEFQDGLNAFRVILTVSAALSKFSLGIKTCLLFYYQSISLFYLCFSKKNIKTSAMNRALSNTLLFLMEGMLTFIYQKKIFFCFLF